MVSSSHIMRLSRLRIFYFSLFRLASVVAFAIVVFLWPLNVYAFDITLAWDPPHSEQYLAGYRIFHRQQGETYDYNQPAWEGADTTCTIYNLDDDTGHSFVARAYDTAGNESSNSNEVSWPPPSDSAGGCFICTAWMPLRKVEN